MLDDNVGLLIDCGLFQGGDWGVDGVDVGCFEIEFDICYIWVLVVIYVYFDYVGCIFWLLVVGFDGLIYCSEFSVELLLIMLEDVFKLVVSCQFEVIWWYL